MCRSYLKFLIIIAFGILFLFTQMQANSKLDSLKDQLNSRIDDELRDTVTLSLFEDVISEYSTVNVDSSIAIGIRALKYFEYDQYSYHLGELHATLASIYGNSNDFKSALEHFTKSSGYYRLVGDSIGLSQTTNNIAYLYKNRNLYDLSLKYFLRSLQIARSLKDKKSESLILANIAFLYKDKQEFDSAFYYLDLYQDINRDRKNIAEVARGYNYFGQIYEAFGKHEKALENYKKSHDLADELNQEPLACNLCQSLGRVYMKLGMYDSAETYLTINYNKIEKFEKYIQKFRIYFDLANLHLAQERYDEAESLVKEAIDLAERNNDKNDLSESLKLYVAILKKKGNLEAALKFNEYLCAVKDSIILMNSNIAIYDLEVNSELLATEKEIEYYQKSTDLYKIIIIFAFISLLSVAALFYFRMRGKAKANLVLQEKNKLIEEQKDELASTNQELLKSKNRLSRLLNKHNAIMYLVDPESFKILDANEAAQSFYGYSQSEFLNMKITDLNIMDEKKIRDEIDKSFARNEGYFVFKHRLKSGENSRCRDQSSTCRV
jgi:PAS domain S-box-containing protein